MFVRPSKINRLITKAYKTTGCYITFKSGIYRIFPDNHSWLLEVMADELDNKIKAKIMELAGALPVSNNTGFKFSKEMGTEWDIEDYIREADKLDVSTDDMQKAYTITDYLLECRNGRLCRVLVDQFGKHELALDSVMDIICKEMDEDTVTGPYMPIWTSASVRWSNWKGSFQFWLESYDSDEPAAEHIAAMDLHKII